MRTRKDVVIAPRPQKQLSPQLCAKALELLREKGRFALSEIERLMGWEKPCGMTIRVMAQQLGITDRQLKYLLHRRDWHKKVQQKRAAEHNARNITFAKYTSHKLGFSILLPAVWQVITDTHERSRLAEEFLEYVRRLKPPREPTRALAYARVSESGSLRPLTEFEERLQAKREHEELVAAAEQQACLERMATGLFQAQTPSDEDGAFVEVTKLQLDSPLTALELYTLNKQLPENVPWGSRPAKGMVVDGLSGVVYYFVQKLVGEKTQEWPVCFNVYLAQGHEAWIISCHCRYGDFYFKTFTHYRPIFRRIISSFERLRIV